MQADTQSTTIEAPADEVFAFVADPVNLPRWAVGFARSVEQDGERWVVRTGAGAAVGLDVQSDVRLGVVDFLICPSPRIQLTAHSRVVPSGGAAVYTFTQHRSPGMDDEQFAAQIVALRHEMTVLKAILEVSCPS